MEKIAAFQPEVCSVNEMESKALIDVMLFAVQHAHNVTVRWRDCEHMMLAFITDLHILRLRSSACIQCKRLSLDLGLNMYTMRYELMNSRSIEQLFAVVWMLPNIVSLNLSVPKGRLGNLGNYEWNVHPLLRSLRLNVSSNHLSSLGFERLWRAALRD